MKFDVVRAWKDAEYRQSLSQQEQAQLPMSPVGVAELSEAELDAIHGAWGSASATAINSLSPVACTNSTVGAGFCISFGVGC